MSDRTVVIIGGTSGIGLELAQRAAARRESVILSGRDKARAEEIAASVGGTTRGIAVDLSQPDTLAEALSDIDRVDALVLAAVERDANTVADYDIDRAIRLVTLKLVGYTEAVHALLPRMPRTADSGIVVFGGRAKDRPYPGSTTVSTINGGVDGLIRTMALELAPIRVNAIHPGIVGDSPFWAGKPEAIAKYQARTPGGVLATMADVVDATEFLLRNRSITATSLNVDSGWEVT